MEECYALINEAGQLNGIFIKETTGSSIAISLDFLHYIDILNNLVSLNISGNH